MTRRMDDLLQLLREIQRLVQQKGLDAKRSQAPPHRTAYPGAGR
jgi:hypothetical protein